jgi:hypothetical protein
MIARVESVVVAYEIMNDKDDDDDDDDVIVRRISTHY